MFSTLERFISLRYLRAKKAEGFISVIAGFSFVGIALGVATLIVVMAVMNGFRDELIKRVLGVDGHVAVVAPAGQGIQNYEDLRQRLAKDEDVISVIPMVEGQVMVTSRAASVGALARGISREDLKQKPLLFESIPDEALQQFDGMNGVVMGKGLARRLGAYAGDVVSLISPQTRSTVLGSIPRMKEFTVLGTFEVGMFEYDNNILLMPLQAGQVFFKRPDAASMLELTLKDPQAASSKADDIRKNLTDFYYLTDWMRTHHQFFNALKVERNVMFLILTLIVLVAAFNIISSLIMLVKSKTQDIAILRTMGLSRASVMRIFFLNGATIGVIGTLVGVTLGLLVALNLPAIQHWLESVTGAELFSAEIYYLSSLPAKVLPEDVTNVTLMALALSFIATLYPAWKAAKTDPAEVLRYS